MRAALAKADMLLDIEMLLISEPEPNSFSSLFVDFFDFLYDLLGGDVLGFGDWVSTFGAFSRKEEVLRKCFCLVFE